MGLTVQLHLDPVLIIRCFGALFWGIMLAVFLQYVRIGKFIAEQRTWLSVVLGIGGDLLIAWQAEWLEICVIISLSAVGMVWRSVVNEEHYQPKLNSYKVKHWMEDAIDDLGNAIRMLECALDDGKAGQVSKALSCAHKAQRAISLARYGEPE